MNRDRVYLFEDGSWCWCDQYSFKTHTRLGIYQEIILGQGWHENEVSKMLREYHEENQCFWDNQ